MGKLRAQLLLPRQTTVHKGTYSAWSKIPRLDQSGLLTSDPRAFDSGLPAGIGAGPGSAGGPSWKPREKLPWCAMVCHLFRHKMLGRNHFRSMGAGRAHPRESELRSGTGLAAFRRPRPRDQQTLRWTATSMQRVAKHSDARPGSEPRSSDLRRIEHLAFIEWPHGRAAGSVGGECVRLAHREPAADRSH
jgi:hypothetical protein